MPDDLKATIHYQSGALVSADHDKIEDPQFPVAPSTSARDTANTIRPSLIPWACWKVEDICFEFGRAFVRPDAQEAFTELAKLREKHPDTPITLFGHADPVGNDQYNKDLSLRRAKAVYAVLIRNTALWEEIYSHKDEQVRFLQNTLAALGHNPGTVDGKMGPKTQAGIRSFEKSEGGPEKGQNTPDLRTRLFKKYMDWLCPDLTLTPSDFLTGGQCAYQGCGEFNPVRMFSKAQNEHFRKPANRQARNDENQPNRRVVAFLFKPGTRVNPWAWPCRSDLASCQKRLWSDWEKRRAFQEKGREHRVSVGVPAGKGKSPWKYEATHDTFACRFYDGLAHQSPCEQPVPPRLGPFVQFEFVVFDHPTCGVVCQVKHQADPEPGAAAVEKVALSHKGTCAATEIDTTGDQEHARDVTGKKCDVSSSRMHVMNAKGSPPMGKLMHGDAVTYDPEYYPSELAHIIPYIVETQAAYDQQIKIFDTTQDQRFDTNELVILWDRQRNKVTKYMLDGEEFVLD